MTAFLTALILLFTSFVQGAAGFGFSLIAVPLLALIMPIKQAVVFLVIMSLILNTVTLLRLRRHTDFRRMIPMLLISSLVTPLGVYLLRIMSGDALLLLSSATMLIFYLVPLDRLHIRLSEKSALFLAASSSGILNAAVGVSGPPVIMYLTSRGVSKQTFRSSLTFYFFFLNLVTIGSLLSQSMIPNLIFRDALVYAPVVFFGTYLGVSAGNRLNEDHFRTIVNYGLLGLLVLNIIKTLL